MLAVLLWPGACSRGEATDGVAPGDLPAPPTDSLTPQRLRRLTTEEMENVLADLLGTRLHLTGGFLRDPRVDGYDNDAVALGLSESKVAEVATLAERVATYMTAAERIAQFAPCPPASDGTLPADSCASAFARWLVTRAWGRGPTADEARRLADLHRAGAGKGDGDYAAGIALQAEAVLQSPHFLFRTELGDGSEPAASDPQPGQVRLTGAEIASAISFLLVGSRPDAELLAAAESGELGTGAGRATQARRLLLTPAARAQTSGFLRAWLGLSDMARINKDLGIFPVFTPTVRQAMVRELNTFFEHVLTAGRSRLDELLLASYTFPAPALAPIYKDDLLAAPGDFTRTALASRRRGVLSSPAFLAQHALIDQTNPVERGLMVRTRLLCQDVAPPPPNVVAETPRSAPGATTRAKYSAHASNPFCQACHQLMDPIGFGLESFDSLGRYRTQENGQPVDAQGMLVKTDVDGPFTGPAELAGRLARSWTFHRCFVKQLWRFGEGRDADRADDPDVDALAAGARATDFRIDELLIAFVARPGFAVRRRTSGEAP